MANLAHYSLTSENLEEYEEIFKNLNIWDAHTHLGKDKDNHFLTLKTLIKQMDEFEVNKSIVFPLNDPNDKRTFKKSNELIWKSYNQHKDRLIPFFRLNPHFNWRDEFKKRVDQGFKGVKLHPRSQRFRLDYSRVNKIYEQIEKHDLVLLIHTGFGLEDIADKLISILQKYKKMRVILGHSGFVDLDNIIKKVSHMDNVLFDTSVIKVFDLFELIDRVDYKKIVFGSDVPYGDIGFGLQAVVDTSISLRKTPFQIKHMLSSNLMRWFK